MAARSSVQSATAKLRAATQSLEFSAPVTHVYRPLEYAAAAVERYEAQFGAGPKPYVLVGMNPGPFGMAQTGIPFGEVGMVRDWMRIDAPVGSPTAPHPKRPVEGFACTRSEVSGKRLWGAIAERHADAKQFFAHAFVVNYCPLLFLSASGANVTPDKLLRNERAPLEAACDQYLRDVFQALTPRVMIGVGQYAEKRR
jgi:single-strand selective monofunctional uracil DNA glycosylase